MPGLELELERSRLKRELCIASGSVAEISMTDDYIATPVDFGYSPVLAPQIYPPATLPHVWETSISFGSEKVCRLARDHIAVKGRHTRTLQQSQYLQFLKDIVGDVEACHSREIGTASMTDENDKKDG